MISSFPLLPSAPSRSRATTDHVENLQGLTRRGISRVSEGATRLIPPPNGEAAPRSRLRSSRLRKGLAVALLTVASFVGSGMLGMAVATESREGAETPRKVVHPDAERIVDSLLEKVTADAHIEGVMKAFCDSKDMAEKLYKYSVTVGVNYQMYFDGRVVIFYLFYGNGNLKKPIFAGYVTSEAFENEDRMGRLIRRIADLEFDTTLATISRFGNKKNLMILYTDGPEFKEYELNKYYLNSLLEERFTSFNYKVSECPFLDDD